MTRRASVSEACPTKTGLLTSAAGEPLAGHVEAQGGCPQVGHLPPQRRAGRHALPHSPQVIALAHRSLQDPEFV